MMLAASTANTIGTFLKDVADSVRVLALPGLPGKGDVIDWARAGGTVELLYELTERLANQWVPSDDADEQRAPEDSDDALALLFAERHAGDLRYIAFRRCWLIWNRSHWLLDETLRAFDLVRAICRAEAMNCKNKRLASVLASAKTIAAAERLSKADRRLAAVPGQWDADPELFNTPTGEDP
jgi:hypothetical protein